MKHEPIIILKHNELYLLSNLTIDLSQFWHDQRLKGGKSTIRPSLGH